MADYAIHDTTLIAQADILRKKFGTSDRQDPADYAYKMNLMGLLEEKTTTKASIAHITDGADTVPIKSWEVEIAPTLTGKSAIECTQSGDSVFFPSDIVQGSISGSGYNAESTTRIRTEARKAVSPSTAYLIKCNSEILIYEVHEYQELTGSSTYTTVNATETTITTKATTAYMRILFRYSNNATITPSALKYIQCTTGTLSPYTVSTVNLGRTIHGGTAYVVKGTGTDGYGIITFDGSNDENWQDYSSYNGYYIAIPTMKVGTRQDGVSNYLTNSKTSAHTQDTYWLGVNSNRLFLIEVYNTMGNNITALRSYLSEHPLTVVYPLATPTDFTFTPITPSPETALGTNNFWADEGDSEVTYRGQGTITPVLPTLISKTITENDTYLAEDDGADGYSEVIVNVSGGGGGSCERLFYARCVNNDQIEIPAISSLEQGANYSSYLSYDSSTKKFTVLQDFTGIVIAWVYTYQTYESTRSDGSFYVNSTQMMNYTATGNTAGSKGGRYGIYNFKQGDTFWMYTPSRNGYPQQNCKVYLISALDDDVFTFADEEA